MEHIRKANILNVYNRSEKQKSYYGLYKASVEY
jgi:hypothetical protein